MGFPDNSVAASLRQPDGKILFAGGFLAHDGFTTRRVARLNVDGSTDTSFVARVGNDHVDPADSPQVSALAIQPTDNHILVGGTFTQVWDTQAVRLARLTPGGSHDTSFVAEANGRVNAIAVQSDGRILVGGEFTQINSIPRQGLARLEPDGTLDLSLNPAPSAPGSPEPVVIRKIIVRDDNSIFVSGSFSRIGGGAAQSLALLDPAGNLTRVLSPVNWVRGPLGTPYPGVIHDLSLSRLWELSCYGQFLNLGAAPTGPYMAGAGRYLPNGALDFAFANTENDNSLAVQVFTGALQPDNSSIIGGSFGFYQYEPRGNLAKLRANGSIDPGFRCDISPLPANPTPTPVQTLATFPDGSVFVGGAFQGAGAATANKNAVRLWRDGSADIGFDPDLTNVVSYPGNHTRFVIQPDGKILVAGKPSGLTSVIRLLRLFANGTVDSSFNVAFRSTGGSPFIRAVAILEDGSILVGGNGLDYRYTGPGGMDPFIGSNLVRLNPDGSLSSFSTVTGGDVRCIVLQPDGKVLIAGTFTHVNGSSRAHLVRLLSNGNLDPDFGPITLYQNGSIVDLDYSHLDGKITICGNFTSVNGSLRNFFARLHSNGTLDTAFYPFITYEGASGGAVISSASVQPDGKTIITGIFDMVGGVSRKGLARLNANGTLDAGFVPAPDPLGLWPTIALQANGQVLVHTVAGAITGPHRIYGVKRFNADGSTDGTFSQRDLGYPSCLALQADGRVLVAGELNTPGGSTELGMARLKNNSAESEIVVLSTDTIAWRRGGSAPEAQHVSFEISTDGCRSWTFLGHGVWTSDRSWVLTDLSLPTSGHIRAKARIPVNFSTVDGVYGDGGGAGSGLVEDVVAFRTPIDFTLARWLMRNYNVPFNISPGMLLRDLDGDSLSDFMEMAFGTHPLDILSGISRLSFNTGPNGPYLLSAGQPTFEVLNIEGSLSGQGQYLRRRDALAEGIFYYPEFSRNLVDWFAAGPDDEEATNVGGEYELIQVSPPDDLPPGNSLFFRVGLGFRP